MIIVKKAKKFYEEKYKKLLLIPFLLLLFAFLQIGLQYYSTGDFVKRGISLKGGVTMTILESSISPIELEQHLKLVIAGSDVSVRSLPRTGGLIIDAANIEAETLMERVESRTGTLPKDKYSIEIIGSSLSESFFKETMIAMLIAFLFMGLVVFATFRTLVPSLAVILAAFSDIVSTLAIFNIFGMKLSTAGIAAFIMLIGYSVDTDILLSTRVLRRKEGRVMDRIYSAVKTGFIMQGTTLAAVITSLTFAQSETIRQIMIILLIGLFVDMINTWIQNVGILRIYLEKVGKHD